MLLSLPSKALGNIKQPRRPDGRPQLMFGRIYLLVSILMSLPPRRCNSSLRCVTPEMETTTEDEALAESRRIPSQNNLMQTYRTLNWALASIYLYLIDKKRLRFRNNASFGIPSVGQRHFRATTNDFFAGQFYIGENT